MTTDYTGLTTIDLAHHFLDATVDTWGVDRGEVDAVLAEVQRRGAKDEFAGQLWAMRADKNLGTTYEKILKTYGDDLVSSILKDELSGTGLNKSLALWNGRTVEHAKGWAARWQGMKDSVSGIGVGFHKMAPIIDEHPYASWFVATPVGAALCLGAGPYVTGGLLLYEGAKAGKSEIDAATTEDPARKEKALEGSGEALGNIGMIGVSEAAGEGLAYGVRSLKGLRSGAGVVRAAEESGEAFPLIVRRPAKVDPTVTMEGVVTVEIPTVEGPTLKVLAAGDTTQAEPIAARMALRESSAGVDASASGTKRIKPGRGTPMGDPTLGDVEPFAMRNHWSGYSLGDGVTKKPDLLEGLATSLTARLRNIASGSDATSDVGAMEAMIANARRDLNEAGRIYESLRDAAGQQRVAEKMRELEGVVASLTRRFRGLDLIRATHAVEMRMMDFLMPGRQPVAGELDAILADIGHTVSRLSARGKVDEAFALSNKAANFLDRVAASGSQPGEAKKLQGVAEAYRKYATSLKAAAPN